MLHRAVRKYFPSLIDLDGVPMSSNLPVQSVPNHVPDPYVELIQAFMAKFFSSLDEPGRPNIGGGYSSDSVFSLTVVTGGGGPT